MVIKYAADLLYGSESVGETSKIPASPEGVYLKSEEVMKYRLPLFWPVKIIYLFGKKCSAAQRT